MDPRQFEARQIRRVPIRGHAPDRGPDGLDSENQLRGGIHAYRFPARAPETSDWAIFELLISYRPAA